MRAGPASSWEEIGPAFREFEPTRPFGSLVGTTRGVLFSPRRFFDRLAPDGPPWPPVFYFLICYLIGTGMEVISTAPFLNSTEALAVLISLLIPLPILLFVLLPVQHTLLFFLSEHEQHGMRTTLRVSCYAAGAIVLIAWIPLADLIAVPHLTYVLIIGLKRMHEVPVARTLLPSLILAALFCVPVAGSILFEYRALQEVTQEPALSRYYFPPPERSEDLPPDITGAVSLLDGDEDQAQIRKLRDASYSNVIPSANGGMVVTILTAGPVGQPRGVSGYVHGSKNGSATETMRIDPEHPERDREGTDHMSYYASEHRSRSPAGYYANPIKQRVLIQYLTFSRGGYTVNLRQESKEPRIISVSTYSDADTRSAETYFQVPYRVARPGDRLRLTIKSGVSLDDLRLEIDRDEDGVYEESWMPEAAVAGGAANDDAPPETDAHVNGVPGRRNVLLLTLNAEDSSQGRDVSPSGVGIMYYWINDSGPRIYMGPVSVEAGDAITYWSVDRAGNSEWRRTTDVLHRSP